jgi:hypothetical protein
MDVTITLTPQQAAQIRRALLLSLERANDLELEAAVHAAYQLLDSCATTQDTAA